MTTWLAVADSPYAAGFLEVIQEPARTITYNGGIRLLRPDVYWLFDSVACRMYAADAYAARADGTWLVTLLRNGSALARRGVGDFDEFIAIEGGVSSQLDRQHWYSLAFSRPYTWQYALHRGATRLVLIGQEGYPPADPRFRYCKMFFEPMLAQAVKLWPEVEFVFCGVPNYTLPASVVQYRTPRAYVEGELCVSS